jgi:catechol 2,3-dioxygenase-like lactoylglutathione lyase family enzyme
MKMIHVAVVVADYDEALAFYTEKLGFELMEDTQLSATKRWVVVRPSGSECAVLLAKAANPLQMSRVGDQTGGRVFLFLQTDDFWKDYERLRSAGVEFVRAPEEAEYGTVAVFKDLYGNLWDLISGGEK